MSWNGVRRNKLRFDGVNQCKDPLSEAPENNYVFGGNRTEGFVGTRHGADGDRSTTPFVRKREERVAYVQMVSGIVRECYCRLRPVRRVEELVDQLIHSLYQGVLGYRPNAPTLSLHFFPFFILTFLPCACFAGVQSPCAVGLVWRAW